MALKKPVNPFDAIAKPKAAAKKTTTKIAATVTNEIKTAVDAVLRLKAEISQKKSELEQQESTVIEHVRPQQDTKARSGEFSKSFYVEGVTGAVLYSTADSFSVPKEEPDQEALQTLIGEALFDAWFKTKRTIALKEGVEQNSELIAKIQAAIEKAGLAVSDVFVVTDVLVHCDDLDRKQYDLDDQTLAEFRALCVPRKPALKGTSKE
jgi:hypothetical protein